jgi:transposase
MKNIENLDPDKKEKERLAEALELNEPLSCACYLKGDLRQVWLQPSKEIAERVFTD